MAKCAGEAVKAFGPVFRFDGAVIHVVTKFKVGVEYAGRLPPATRNVATAEFRARHVRPEHRIGV